MSREKDPVLRFLSDLWGDIQDPGFVWQIVALISCLLVAAWVSRWWQKRSNQPNDKLQAAGARLAFPVVALLLVGIVRLCLKPFFHVNLLKLAFPLLSSMALVRGVVFVFRQAFPRAAWLAAWERIIAAVVWGWLALYITDLTPYVIDSLEEIDFSVGKETFNLWMILHGIVTVFLTIVTAMWGAGMLEARLMRVEVIDTSLRIVLVRVSKALLTVIAFLGSLALVGIDMTALSVFTGALGVGLGLGLQKIASNYISGFIILLDRSIRIGNVVHVGAQSGQVTQITTRFTVLKHPTGCEYIVPNESLVNEVVQNQTFTDSKMRLATTVGVAYDSDLDLVARLLCDAAKEHPRVLLDPPPSALLISFADSSINMELGFWIADPEAGRGNVLSDINFSIWRLFKEHQIQIPFPQREVRLLGEPAATPVSDKVSAN